MQDHYPIETPNGVLLHNQNEALSYVQHFCDDCPRNNLMNPCSEAQAEKCNQHKKELLKQIQHIAKRKENHS